MQQSKNYKDAIEALTDISNENCRQAAFKFISAVEDAVNKAAKELPHSRQIPNLDFHAKVGELHVQMRFTFNESKYVFWQNGLNEFISTYTRRFETRELVKQINSQE